MIADYSVRVFNKVDDVGKDPIDSISNDPFFTYGWFKTLEKQTDFPIYPFYIAVYDNAELIAFAPCFLDKLDEYFVHGLYYFPFMRKILILGDKLKLWQKNMLISYSPSCYRSKIIMNDNIAKNEVLHLIYKKMDEICKEENLLFSSLPFVSEHDSTLLTSINCHGYSQLAWKCTYYIDIHWSNFEDYLASLDYKVRKNVNREIRKFLTTGIVLEEIHDFQPISEKLADLSSNLIKKYNPGERSNKQGSFFRSLNENAKDNARVIVAKKDGKIAGYLLLMQQKKTLDCFICGFDYGFLSNATFLYFNLVYYYPMKLAIKTGINRIYYRWSADKIKLHRGCEPEQIFLNLKCHNRLIALFFSLYMRQKNTRLGQFITRHL